jgi:lysophospholipase L1-like esterase
VKSLLSRTLRACLATLTLCAWLPASGQDPARFEREIAAFEAADRAAAPLKPAGVLLYGSSSFRLWKDVAEAFPTANLVNRGFGGAHLSDLNHFFDRVVVPQAPRIVLVYGGDNDIASGKSPETVLSDFKELVERIHKTFPRARVCFVAIKPSPSRLKFLEAHLKANELVRRYAQSARRVDFVDTATPILNEEGKPDPKYFVADQLHLGPAGYEVWREVIGKYLERQRGWRK